MTNKNMQWWKIGLCVLAVVMIAGIVTYTLMMHTSANAAIVKAPSRAAALRHRWRQLIRRPLPTLWHLPQLLARWPQPSIPCRLSRLLMRRPQTRQAN